MPDCTCTASAVVQLIHCTTAVGSVVSLEEVGKEEEEVGRLVCRFNNRLTLQIDTLDQELVDCNFYSDLDDSVSHCCCLL